ncbi:hypothetical protein AMECASPLE_023408 [Ameca splendens]|uniref:Uncharacterized protein n=1 Tax=Ameca splendens TaxID=208324 RepID=A0ABV0ZFE1_9TELE
MLVLSYPQSCVQASVSMCVSPHLFLCRCLPKAAAQDQSGTDPPRQMPDCFAYLLGNQANLILFLFLPRVLTQILAVLLFKMNRSTVHTQFLHSNALQSLEKSPQDFVCESPHCSSAHPSVITSS